MYKLLYVAMYIHSYHCPQQGTFYWYLITLPRPILQWWYCDVGPFSFLSWSCSFVSFPAQVYRSFSFLVDLKTRTIHMCISYIYKPCIGPCMLQLLVTFTVPILHHRSSTTEVILLQNHWASLERTLLLHGLDTVWWTPATGVPMLALALTAWKILQLPCTHDIYSYTRTKANHPCYRATSPLLPSNTTMFVYHLSTHLQIYTCLICPQKCYPCRNILPV